MARRAQGLTGTGGFLAPTARTSSTPPIRQAISERWPISPGVCVTTDPLIADVADGTPRNRHGRGLGPEPQVGEHLLQALVRVAAHLGPVVSHNLSSGRLAATFATDAYDISTAISDVLSHLRPTLARAAVELRGLADEIRIVAVAAELVSGEQARPA